MRDLIYCCQLTQVSVNIHLNQDKRLFTKSQLHITCFKACRTRPKKIIWVKKMKITDGGNRSFPTTKNTDHHNQLVEALYKIKYSDLF